MDSGDTDFYDNLDEEQKKTFSPWLAMRWASAVETKYSMHYLLAVNDLVNCDFSVLKPHPGLQWKLISACGIGSKQRHVFVRPPKGSTSSKLEDFVSSIHPHYKHDEIELFLKLNSKEDLIDMAKSLGYTDEEIKEIFKTK